MGHTQMYNKGFQYGAILFFLVEQKGITFSGLFEGELLENPSFDCGYEAGFRQYME